MKILFFVAILLFPLGRDSFGFSIKNLAETRLGFLPKPSATTSSFVSIPGIPDTLEIFVMYVEFKSEDSEDNVSTTGKGTFNSAFDSNFTLDPNGFRDYAPYLEKHMEFARDYFNKISNGRLHIRWRFFPEPESNKAIKTPFQLSKRMASYNPTKKDEEKNVVFFERKANALMSFVAEALRKANGAENSDDNPFTQDPPPSSNTFRCYMIFHAGHNGLIDGGNLGQLGADTPHDIIDFFVTREDFALLTELPEENLGNPLLPQPEDTLGVAVGTGRITEVMVLGESASQDDVNFGINGILVNQIARQIGMPDTWDRGTGFTQLGYFDLMDVGHLSVFGFVPVFPSAWIRYYMGWETPVTAYPGKNGESDYTLYPPQLTAPPVEGSVPAVKIPLNDKEYLLVENRQRAINDSITIRFSYPSNKNSPEFDVEDSVTVALSFMDSLLLDSLCDNEGKNCVENKRRPKGIITSVSSYDAGLPGSGLLVWHVNEWYISEAIRYGFVNASSEESKEFVGINLVEADGDLSIGKEGKDQLGQSVFDFGSGSDMFPTIRKKIKEIDGKDTTWEKDTLSYISPYGFSNTNSWNDGRTHISLRALIPDSSAGTQPGINGIFLDSLWNFGDSLLTLRVSWNDNPAIKKAENSFWPRMTPPASNTQSLVTFELNGEPVVLSLSDSGIYQSFDIKANPILPVYDTLVMEQAYDSLFTLLPTGKNTDSVFIPSHSYGNADEVLKASAAGFDSVFFVLSEKGNLWAYRTFKVSQDSGNSDSFEKTRLSGNIHLGPVVIGSEIWAVNKDFELVAFDEGFAQSNNISLPNLNYQNMCYVHESGAEGFIALAAKSGQLVLVDLDKKEAKKIHSSWAPSSEFFHVLSSDFDRDGNYDLLLFGSRGSVQLVNIQGEAFANFPLALNRFKIFVDSAGRPEIITQDLSAPSLGDINQDGYPDVVFTGPNAVSAINHLGNLMWSTPLEERQNVGVYYSSENFPATVVGSTPLIFEMDSKKGPVVLIASPDGLIWALDGNGRFLENSAFNGKSNIARQSGVKSSDKNDWPLAAGTVSFDTLTSPFVNIALAPNTGENGLVLFSQSGRGGLNSWIFPEARFSERAHWGALGGSAKRQSLYSVENLPEPASLSETRVIRDFHIYPSPVTENFANVYLDLGAPAVKARIRAYDLSGLVVIDKNLTGFETMGGHSRSLDFSKLGPDVYTMLMEVWFDKGVKKQKWTRVGVIK